MLKHPKFYSLICLLLLSLASCATYQGTSLERYTEFTRDGVLYSKCSAAYPSGSLSTSVLRMDKIVPKQVMVGKEYTYQFVVTNLRQTALKNVTIIDDIHTNYRIISSTPPATMEGNKAKWYIPSIPGGKQVTVNVTATSDRTGTISSCGTVSYDDQVCATTEVLKVGLKAAISAPRNASLCDIIPLVYTATNTGSATLNNVYIDGGSTSELIALDGTRGGQMPIGTLAPGETKQVKVDSKATKQGDFKTTIRAVSDKLTSDEVSSMTLVSAPILKVDVSAPSSIVLGKNLSYDVVVSNSGNGPSNNTIISSPLPAGASFISASNGGTLSAGNQIVWPSVNLTSNSTTRLKATIRPPAIPTIRTEASAKTECAQPASASAMTSMEGISAILLEMVDIEDPVEVGKPTTYVITVTNQGSAPNTNVVITCNLESTQEYVSSSGASIGSSSGSTVSFASLPSIQAQGVAVWKVTVRNLKASDTRFKVSLQSSELERPVEKTEATKIY